MGYDKLGVAVNALEHGNVLDKTNTFFGEGGTMTKLLGISVVLAVMGVSSSAQAQTYTYRFTQHMSSHAGEETSKGTLKIKKLRRTAQGYTAYLGTRTTNLKAGKKRIQVASVMEVKTSKGTRMFAVYNAKKPFWLYILRKTPQGLKLTMLDAWGFTEEAKRVTAAKRVIDNQLRDTVSASGKNKFGAWSATVALNDDKTVTWMVGKQRLYGTGCSVGNTHAFSVSKLKDVTMFCYKAKGTRLSGEQALQQDVPASVTDKLQLKSKTRR